MAFSNEPRTIQQSKIIPNEASVDIFSPSRAFKKLMPYENRRSHQQSNAVSRASLVEELHL